MKPLETIKGSSYSGNQSKYLMFSRPFTNSVNYDVNSIIPNNSGKENQKITSTQNYSKTINIKNNEVDSQSSVVNLNLNKNDSDLIRNNSNSKGKSVKFELVDAIMKNRTNINSTQSEANPVIKIPYENSKANNLNNYNSLRSIPIKSAINEVIPTSSLGKTYQIENIYNSGTNKTEQNNSLKNTYIVGNKNINISEENKIKNKGLNYASGYNINNFNSLKMTQHFPERNTYKDNEEIPNLYYTNSHPKFSENDKYKSVNNTIITQEIILNKESGNLDASYNFQKPNFPDNVKSIRILEKDINFNNNNKNDLNYDLNPNNVQNEEPYIKKKIIKKLIEFKDGSSEVIYYEK